VGTSLVSGFLPIDVDVERHRVRMNVWGFSRYIMSTGRRSTY
jgi:hypothetical protein